MKGKIKWYNRVKGYGFIVPDDGGKDVFVHHTVIEGGAKKGLPDGQVVEYEVSEGPKGPTATKAQVVKTA